MEPVTQTSGTTTYVSPINPNMEYAVTFRHNSPNGVTCFGYMPESVLAYEFRTTDGEAVDFSTDVSRLSVGVCTDGRTNNYYREQEVCRGDLNTVRD